MAIYPTVRSHQASEPESSPYPRIARDLVMQLNECIESDDITELSTLLSERPLAAKLMVDHAEVSGYSPVHFAALSGNIDALQRLLAVLTPEQGTRLLDVKNGHYGNPLVIASTFGHPAIIELLIDYRANVGGEQDHSTWINKDHGFALHKALDGLHIEAVAILLYNGADPNCYCHTYGAEAPIFAALRNVKDAHAIRLLHEAGANLHVRMDGERTVLMQAACTGNADAVKYILDADKERLLVNAVDEGGDTALSICMAGNIVRSERESQNYCAEILLLNGADINIRPSWRDSVLFEAVRSHDAQRVQMIIDAGVEFDKNDGKIIEVVFEEVKLTRSFDIAERLLGSEAVASMARELVVMDSADKLEWYISRPDEGLRSYLKHLEKCGHLEAVSRSLLPLHFAAAGNNADSFKILLGSFLAESISIHDEDGLTPLMVAAQRGSCESLEALIIADASLYKEPNGSVAFAANLEVTDHQGRTAFMHAVLEQRWQAAQMLINAGANLNAINDSGKTAFEIAQSVLASQTHNREPFGGNVARSMQETMDFLKQNGAVGG